MTHRSDHVWDRIFDSPPPRPPEGHSDADQRQFDDVWDHIFDGPSIRQYDDDAKAAPRVGAGRRALGALLTNAISSLGNFAVSITIAHTGTLADLGKFGVALAVYVLVTGMIRTAVTDTVLSREHSFDLNRDSIRRVVLLGLATAVLTVVAGLILSQGFVTLLGCAVPGIVVYDYLKIVNLGTGTTNRALAQESIWTVATLLFAALGLTHWLTSYGVFAGWAFSCAVIGSVHALLLRYSLVPAWNVNRDETKVGLTFAFDFLAGSGIAQVTTMLIAATAGFVVAGVLRGAGTILAPLTILAGTLPSLLIPYLARARSVSAEAALHAARKVSWVAAAGAVATATGLLLIPSSLGHVVLATNWEPARSVLPMSAAEILFTILAAVPFAGHRVERAGLRALKIRLIRAPFQVAIVVTGGVLFGAKGATSAMAAMAMVGAVSWWLSYRQLLRRSDQ